MVASWEPSLQPSQLSHLYHYLSALDFSVLLSPFITRLQSFLARQPDLIDPTPNVLTSGAVCYLGTYVLALLQGVTLTDQQDDQAFRFALLYMMVDTFLDHPAVDASAKKVFISTIREVIAQPVSVTTLLRLPSSPFLKEIFKQVFILLQAPASTVTYLKEAFKAEIDSAILQAGANRSRSEYLEMARLKGGTTVAYLQALTGKEVTDDEYQLGYIIQLVDDLLDVDEDLKAGIVTIVTYDYALEGSIDGMLKVTTEEIDKLPARYNVFKMFFGLALLYVKIRRRDYLSDKLKEEVKDFEWVRGISALIGNKLLSGLKS